MLKENSVIQRSKKKKVTALHFEKRVDFHEKLKTNNTESFIVKTFNNNFDAGKCNRSWMKPFTRSAN